MAAHVPEPLYMGTRRTPIGWVMGIVVFAIVCLLLLPAISTLGDKTRVTERFDPLYVNMGYSLAPAGWVADIDDAASGSPFLTRGDAQVRLTGGVWFGSSERLVNSVLEALDEAGFDAQVEGVIEPGSLTSAIHMTEIVAAEREGDRERRVWVTRESFAVVMVAATYPEGAYEEYRRDLDMIVYNVGTAAADIDYRAQTSDIADLLEVVGSQP